MTIRKWIIIKIIVLDSLADARVKARPKPEIYMSCQSLSKKNLQNMNKTYDKKYSTEQSNFVNGKL